MATDSKKINATTMNFAMRYGILKIRRELREQFDKYPEDPNGVEIKYHDLEEKLELLITDGLGYVKELLGATPEINEDALDAYKEDIDTKEEIEVTSGVLVQRETFRTHWDAYRGRQVAFMRREVAYYGVPIEFTLTGGGSAHVSVQHLNPVTVGDAPFTVIDDMHFGGNNPNKAEFMAPEGCTEEVTVTVRFNKWGTNNTPVVGNSGDEMDSSNYNSNQLITFKDYKDKSFQWMSHTGSYYGGPTLFVYADGSKLFVPDAKVTYGKDGNNSNINQPYYMCGTDPRHNKMNGRASIFTGKGDKQKDVTVYFNR